MNSNDNRSPGELAHDYRGKGDPSGWFELVYAQTDTSGSGVPWAKMEPNPYLVSWLKENNINGTGKTALVVGCGLGDDAQALVEHGYDVTAFDISESAIEISRKRFPDSRANYLTADLFSPPDSWLGAFGFVFENITVQALPPELQEKAIDVIAQFAAPGGNVMSITTARHPAMSPAGPPWPISRDSLNRYLDQGLSLEFEHVITLNETPELWQIQTLYHRSL